MSKNKKAITTLSGAAFLIYLATKVGKGYRYGGFNKEKQREAFADWLLNLGYNPIVEYQKFQLSPQSYIKELKSALVDHRNKYMSEQDILLLDENDLEELFQEQQADRYDFAAPLREQVENFIAGQKLGRTDDFANAMYDSFQNNPSEFSELLINIYGLDPEIDPQIIQMAFDNLDIPSK